MWMPQLSLCPSWTPSLPLSMPVLVPHLFHVYPLLFLPSSLSTQNTICRSKSWPLLIFFISNLNITSVQNSPLLYDSKCSVLEVELLWGRQLVQCCYRGVFDLRALESQHVRCSGPASMSPYIPCPMYRAQWGLKHDPAFTAKTSGTGLEHLETFDSQWARLGGLSFFLITRESGQGVRIVGDRNKWD